MKNTLKILMIFTLSCQLWAGNFKEIEILEDNGVKIEKNEEKIVEENQEINQLIEENKMEEKTTEDTEENIEKPVINNENIKDIALKKVKSDGLVYLSGEEKPYTGEFALFLGDIIEYKESYVDGRLNGDKIWYSDEGKIVLLEHYKNNRIYGEQKAFFDNGNIKSIVEYDNNRIKELKIWNREGEMIYSQKFRDGNGVWKYYWENGQLMESGEYKNWKKEGKWIKYKKNGKIDVETEYKNNRIISQNWG